MNSSLTIKLIAACAGITWATASFGQHSGHASGHVARPMQNQSPPASNYAGEQTRAIKSLSETDVEGLQAGAGMAYAKAAELNGYPGPAHVLELASQLQLDSAQRSATQSLMDQHRARARQLGADLVEAERSLDIAFASKKVDAQVVEDLTRNIGVVQARLRAEHLQPHLTQTALMTPQQIAGYQRLRGYDQPATR
jgi:hypothetical protein